MVQGCSEVGSGLQGLRWDEEWAPGLCAPRSAWHLVRASAKSS